MSRILYIASVVVALTAGSASAQTITVTAPSAGANAVAAANDFATTAMQDPWDMNERTDVGWFVNSVDQPPAGWSSVSFAGGVFSGIVSADPNVWLLETGYVGAAPVGKFGTNFPINANQYRMLAIRMRVPTSNGYILFHWSTNTIFDPPGIQTSTPVYTSPGWRIYFVDLATLGLLAGSESWSGVKRSLRLDPAPDNEPAGGNIQIDWIRLVDHQPSLYRTITWSGTGPVDIYLDDDNTTTSDPNQTLGLVASNVSGTSYSLNVGALAPGDYYVKIRRTGQTGNFSVSPGFYRVNAPPTIAITSPSDEGSADDFATVHLNNAWDMTSLSDMDHTINVTGQGIVTVPNAETEAGAPLGNITAFSGTSTVGEFNPGPCASFAKPALYPMHSVIRGLARRIDPQRYRILTAELGLPNKARDICGGSVVRVVWHVAGDTYETYSDDIVINSRVGANVVARLNFDMAAIPIEPGSPSHTGWVPGFSSNPGIMSFRIDPHEFPNPTQFFVKRVKLAALDIAHTSFNIQWTTSKTGGTINVYRDVDKDPSSKTLIGSVAASSLNGSMTWNTSSLSDGAQYFIYVEQADGTNTNGTYSKWPVVIDHTPPSNVRLVLNRTRLNFAVTNQTVMTPPQVLRLTVLNAPAGQPCWTASTDLSYLIISPASGCGSAALTVALANQPYHGSGTFGGSVRIDSAGAINSPQFTQVYVSIHPATAPPAGTVDTPAHGATAMGSLPVTGWAIDDVGVARVTICRDPVSGESAPPNGLCGPGQIYIGDAVSIEDARPDIEVHSPGTPMNYRAGWGYLMLTNMLPNQGTGTFTLSCYAFDVEGQRGFLGFRTITALNNQASAPFGAIDTPGQGETIGGTGYPNFGWVLSRVRLTSPFYGGVVTVFIDGVAVGAPGGWTSRADLTQLFPTYPGVNRALGLFGINTTNYANGVHTISWVVTDVAGVSSGIGSRFFWVFNTSGSLTEASAANAMRPVGPDLGKPVGEVRGQPAALPVVVREGFALNGPVRRAAIGLDGARRVTTEESSRIELRLAPSSESTRDEYAGYLVVDGRLRELPNGSSFDPARGAFYWQPGIGYVGNYEFLFVRTRADGARERIPVNVTIQDRPGVSLASALSRAWTSVTFNR